MNVLVLSTIFPNPAQPVHGLFVRRRIVHASQLASIRVVAPVAWFTPLARAARLERDGALVVAHPRFFYVPGLFKILDGLFLFLSVLPTVRRWHAERAIDLIDAHFGYPEGAAAMLLGRVLRRPVVLTLRGSEIDFMAYPLRRRAITWAVRRAARVVAVSGELADLALRLGVPRERIAVIENGVDLESFTPGDRCEAHRQLGIDTGARLVVSAGHLVPRKGFHHLIDAMAPLMTADPRLRLAIVGGRVAGSGNYPDRLAAAARARGVADRVVFAGRQEPRLVARWMQAAELFVLASAREGCANVILEALACGRPVVASEVGHARAALDERTGLLVRDPSDTVALGAAIRHALTQRWDAGAIRSRAEEMGWPEVAIRTAAQWRLAAGEKAGGDRATDAAAEGSRAETIP